jgi:hypothetical protein
MNVDDSVLVRQRGAVAQADLEKRCEVGGLDTPAPMAPPDSVYPSPSSRP